jgi:hypothetical protein
LYIVVRIYLHQHFFKKTQNNLHFISLNRKSLEVGELRNTRRTICTNLAVSKSIVCIFAYMLVG